MSALGQKRTLRGVRPMSALPPKADMDQDGRDVRLVPEAELIAIHFLLARGGICATESAQRRDAASQFLVRFRFHLFLPDGDADHAAYTAGGRYRAFSPVSARPPVQGPGLA